MSKKKHNKSKVLTNRPKEDKKDKIILEEKPEEGFGGFPDDADLRKGLGCGG